MTEHGQSTLKLPVRTYHGIRLQLRKVPGQSTESNVGPFNQKATTYPRDLKIMKMRI